MLWKYFSEHIVPTTTKAVDEKDIKQKLTLEELKKWMRIWFFMSLHPQYSTKELFYSDRKGNNKQEENDFWDPPNCGEYI